MNATAEKPAPALMKGSGGFPKYFPFARKGNVLLGIKINGAASGKYFNVPGTTYFSGRLRSAPENGLLADQATDTNVVKLQPNPPNLWDAWPDVDWEKKDETRASTTVGIFLRGAIGGDAADQEKLAKAIKGGELTQKMTDYLVSVAGEDNMIVQQRELKAWLDEQFGALFAKIVEGVEKAKQLAAACEESIGFFGAQASLLKKVYGETKAHGPDSEDAGHGDDDPIEGQADDGPQEGEAD